jgi:hypothetical protein
MTEEPTGHPCKVTLLPILSVKPQGSLAQEANCKAQDSFLPDLLCPLPAVPSMQTALDEDSGGVLFLHPSPVEEREMTLRLAFPRAISIAFILTRPHGLRNLYIRTLYQWSITQRCSQLGPDQDGIHLVFFTARETAKP